MASDLVIAVIAAETEVLNQPDSVFALNSGQPLSKEILTKILIAQVQAIMAPPPAAAKPAAPSEPAAAPTPPVTP